MTVSSSRKILVSGSSESNLNSTEALVSRLADVEIHTLAVQSLQLPLQGEISGIPDIWIHCLGDHKEHDLRTLMGRPKELRPAIILITRDSVIPPSEIRMAMRAGVYDFITSPIVEEDLLDCLRCLMAETHTDKCMHSGITAFVSPKSGAGAASLAGATAHALASQLHLSTLLVDLDTQFGSQYLNFDLHPTLGLKEALEAMRHPGGMTISGYVAHHASGLHVMGTPPTQVLIPGDVDPDELLRLLHLLQQHYDQIIIDLPCLIDPVFNVVIEHIRHLMIVVQQDIQNIHNAQKLINILRNDLQIPENRISLIINRYEDNHTVKMMDIERALQLKAMITIPNDFDLVNGAANLGHTILEQAPESPVVERVLELAAWLANRQKPEPARHSWLTSMQHLFD